MPLGGSAAHAVTYLLLTAWSLGGPRRAIEALTLTWLVSFLNPGIYSLTDKSGLLRWAVIGTAFLTVVVSAVWRQSAIPRTILWLLVFAFVSGALSLAVSYAPDVSLFKLFSFVMAAIAVVLGFHLTRHEAKYWQTWFLTFFSTVVLVSFPLIVSGVGYYRNQQGFQGLLNHPQAYGIFIGAFAAWLMVLLFEKRLRGPGSWLLMVVVTVSLFATQSRTGTFAAVGAAFLTLAWSMLKRPGTVRHGMIWLVRLSPFILLAMAVVILKVDAVSHVTEQFILKRQVGYTVGEAYQASRGGIADASLANFYEHPVTGIGFGVASDPSDLHISPDPFFGLPVGAPVEKGFAVLAALEEVGLVGFMALLILIGSLLWPAFRIKADITPVALALGALLVNFGESIFFALGGSGLFVWLLLGAARVMGGERR